MSVENAVSVQATVDGRFVARGVVFVFVAIAAMLSCVVAWLMMPLLAIMLAFPLVLSLALDRRAFLAWSVQSIVFLVFIVARFWADETGIPWRGEYAAAMDMVLGLGRNPTALLQAHLRSSWLDVFTSGMYVSFFVVPSLVAMTLWLRRRGFRDYVAAFAIVHGISLAVHYALPTIPPWMASASGMIEPIERIFLDVMQPSAPQIMEAGYLTSSNDVAAMPSVHMAITTLAALGLARLGRAAAIAGGTYAVLMLFSITYLGEHYIVDGVAGIVVAVLAWRVARPVANWMFGNTTQRARRLHEESTSSGFPDPASQVAE